jgi:hypothetical protein
MSGDLFIELGGRIVSTTVIRLPIEVAPASGRDGATVADGQSGPAPLNHDRLDPS